MKIERGTLTAEWEPSESVQRKLKQRLDRKIEDIDRVGSIVAAYSPFTMDVEEIRNVAYILGLLLETEEEE